MKSRFHFLYVPRSASRFAGIFGALAAALVAGSASAHSDVLLVNVGGKATIGAAEDIGGPGQSFDLDAKVFEGILLAGGLLPPHLAKDFEGDEPGFFALDAVAGGADLSTLGAAALPAGAGVSINLTSFSLGGGAGEVLYWSGVGAPAFEPVAAGITFGFEPALNFGTTGAGGSLDAHPIYQLDDGVAGKPTDGVYVIAPSISVAGLGSSDPFYLVLLVDQLIVSEDDAEELEEALEAYHEGLAPDAMFGGKNFAFYEEAVEFVEEAVDVPEPAALALAATALAWGAIGLRGRRQD